MAGVIALELRNWTRKRKFGYGYNTLPDFAGLVPRPDEPCWTGTARQIYEAKASDPELRSLVSGGVIFSACWFYQGRRVHYFATDPACSYKVNLETILWSDDPLPDPLYAVFAGSAPRTVEVPIPVAGGGWKLYHQITEKTRIPVASCAATGGLYRTDLDLGEIYTLIYWVNRWPKVQQYRVIQRIEQGGAPSPWMADLELLEKG